MKILLVNKFLYPKGGSETYVFEVGKELESRGHSVSYFGQKNANNVVGNASNLLVSARTLNPFKLIYSREAYNKFHKLLATEKPDVVHLNNINFQLTPSIIYAARKMQVPVVWTIHDPQLVCPNHRLFIEHDMKVCTQCVDGDVCGCIKNKCFDNSRIKSLIGYLEAKKYYRSDIYDYVSKFICPSRFMADMLMHRFPAEKIEALSNYCKFQKCTQIEKEDYILYYGRISEEKGIKTLLKAVPSDIKLVIAGKGPLESILQDLSPNVSYVGFQSGEELKKLIQKAKFSIYPSEWYENCPFSVIESISFGTPVIGAKIGGIPELIEDGKTGLLFEAGNADDLRDKIQSLYYDDKELSAMIQNAEEVSFMDLKAYCTELLSLYQSVIKH